MLGGVVDRLKSLNGWQRIWIVATALWLPASGVIVFVQMPSRDEVAARHTYLSYSVLVSKENECNRLKRYSVPYNDCWNNISESTRESEIDSELLQNDFSAIVCLGLLGFLPSFALYGLGLATCWVLAGFKESRKPAGASEQ